MNITRHLYLSTAVCAPDDAPAASEPAGDAPPAAEVVAIDPSQSDAPPLAPEPAPAPVVQAPPMVPLRVLQQRIGEETNKRQAVEGRLTAAETKAANLQAIIERMQAERAAPADQNAPPAAAPRAAPVEQPNMEEAVRREVDSRDVARSINDVIGKGVAEFTQAQWDEKAGILAALGAATPEFVQDVIAVDPANAHRIIFALAEDPGKAADLAAMPLRQRTAELTRMSMAEQAKAPPAAKTEPVVVTKATISKAPAPTTVTRTNADVGEIDPTTPDGNDKMSDAQWEKWFKEKNYKRG